MRQSAEARKAQRRAHYLANQEEFKRKAREYAQSLDPEVKLARQRAYHAANKERIAAQRKEYRKTLDRTKYKGADRDLHLRRKYGITHAQYEQMLEAQGGVCAGCGTDGPKSKGDVFHVDHCHKTGFVRGLLCKPCNTGLGNLQDSVEILMSLAAYVLQSTDVLTTEGSGQDR